MGFRVNPAIHSTATASSRFIQWGAVLMDDQLVDIAAGILGGQGVEIDAPLLGDFVAVVGGVFSTDVQSEADVAKARWRGVVWMTGHHCRGR